jgi:hypothetical protein
MSHPCPTDSPIVAGNSATESRAMLAPCCLTQARHGSPWRAICLTRPLSPLPVLRATVTSFPATPAFALPISENIEPRRLYAQQCLPGNLAQIDLFDVFQWRLAIWTALNHAY